MPDKIWFHADDYGVTLGQSQRILDCHRYGVLNSVSILPNVLDISRPKELLDLQEAEGENIRRILHLNFVEGASLSDKSKVSMLVDKDGNFNRSFVDILKWNCTLCGKRRKRLAKQLKTEIAAQLRRVCIENDFKITGIDSHQHYHMIPIVFDALLEVLALEEFKNVDIRYIRIPLDPLGPIIENWGRVRKVPLINWAKWMILRLYSNRNKRILHQRGIKTPVFFGIFYTCEMKYDVVKGLLDSYKAYADKKNQELELMFHPGNLESEYELLDAKSIELKEFYMSEDRFLEAQCLRDLR